MEPWVVLMVGFLKLFFKPSWLLLLCWFCVFFPFLLNGRLCWLYCSVVFSCFSPDWSPLLVVLFSCLSLVFFFARSPLLVVLCFSDLSVPSVFFLYGEAGFDSPANLASRPLGGAPSLLAV